jgi:hypothetical protein
MDPNDLPEVDTIPAENDALETPEDSDSDATPRAPRTFQEIVALARQKAEAGDEESAAGGDEGQQPEGSDPEVEEQGEPAKTDAENEPDGDAADGDPQAPPTELPAPEKDAGRDEEIKALKEEINLLKNLHLAKSAVEAKTPPSGVTKRVMELALSGSTPAEEAEWNALPQNVRDEAKQRVREHMAQEAARVTDPDSYFAPLRQKIVAEIEARMGPVLENQRIEEAKRAYFEMAPDLADPKDIQEVGAAFKALKVPQDASFNEKRYALLAAIEKVRGTRKVPSQKDQAAAAQADAREKSKALARPRGVSGVAQPAPMPRKAKGEALSDYMERLKQHASIAAT